MKKNKLVLFSLLCTSTIFAQEVVSTQGDSYSNGSANVDFTIGEVVINTETDGTYDITQGFHQTNWNFAGLDDLAPELEVNVYPNPSSDVLFVSTVQFEGVSYTLTDANGKIIKGNDLSLETTSIDVKQLAPGNYSVILYDRNQNKLKVFKLIKNQ